MAKRVFHLSVAIGPKRVGHGHLDATTGVDGAMESGVGLLGVVEMDCITA